LFGGEEFGHDSKKNVLIDVYPEKNAAIREESLRYQAGLRGLWARRNKLENQQNNSTNSLSAKTSNNSQAIMSSPLNKAKNFGPKRIGEEYKKQSSYLWNEGARTCDFIEDVLMADANSALDVSRGGHIRFVKELKHRVEKVKKLREQRAEEVKAATNCQQNTDLQEKAVVAMLNPNSAPAENNNSNSTTNQDTSARSPGNTNFSVISTSSVRRASYSYTTPKNANYLPGITEEESAEYANLTGELGSDFTKAGKKKEKENNLLQFSSKARRRSQFAPKSEIPVTKPELKLTQQRVSALIKTKIQTDLQKPPVTMENGDPVILMARKQDLFEQASELTANTPKSAQHGMMASIPQAASSSSVIGGTGSTNTNNSVVENVNNSAASTPSNKLKKTEIHALMRDTLARSEREEVSTGGLSGPNSGPSLLRKLSSASNSSPQGTTSPSLSPSPKMNASPQNGFTGRNGTNSGSAVAPADGSGNTSGISTKKPPLPPNQANAHQATANNNTDGNDSRRASLFGNFFSAHQKTVEEIKMEKAKEKEQKMLKDLQKNNLSGVLGAEVDGIVKKHIVVDDKKQTAVSNVFGKSIRKSENQTDGEKQRSMSIIVPAKKNDDDPSPRLSANRNSTNALALKNNISAQMRTSNASQIEKPRGFFAFAHNYFAQKFEDFARILTPKKYMQQQRQKRNMQKFKTVGAKVKLLNKLKGNEYDEYVNDGAGPGSGGEDAGSSLAARLFSSTRRREQGIFNKGGTGLVLENLHQLYLAGLINDEELFQWMDRWNGEDHDKSYDINKTYGLGLLPGIEPKGAIVRFATSAKFFSIPLEDKMRLFYDDWIRETEGENENNNNNTTNKKQNSIGEENSTALSLPFDMSATSVITAAPPTPTGNTGINSLAKSLVAATNTNSSIPPGSSNRNSIPTFSKNQVGPIPVIFTSWGKPSEDKDESKKEDENNLKKKENNSSSSPNATLISPHRDAGSLTISYLAADNLLTQTEVQIHERQQQAKKNQFDSRNSSNQQSSKTLQIPEKSTSPRAASSTAGNSDISPSAVSSVDPHRRCTVESSISLASERLEAQRKKMRDEINFLHKKVAEKGLDPDQDTQAMKDVIEKMEKFMSCWGSNSQQMLAQGTASASGSGTNSGSRSSSQGVTKIMKLQSGENTTTSTYGIMKNSSKTLKYSQLGDIHIDNDLSSGKDAGSSCRQMLRDRLKHVARERVLAREEAAKKKEREKKRARALGLRRAATRSLITGGGGSPFGSGNTIFFYSDSKMIKKNNLLKLKLNLKTLKMSQKNQK